MYFFSFSVERDGVIRSFQRWESGFDFLAKFLFVDWHDTFPFVFYPKRSLEASFLVDVYFYHGTWLFAK